MTETLKLGGDRVAADIVIEPAVRAVVPPGGAGLGLAVVGLAGHPEVRGDGTAGDVVDELPI